MSKECHPRDMNSLLLYLLFLMVLLVRSETKRWSFNAEMFSTRFFPPLRRSFFLFPFPIVFRSRNFFFLFLSLLMSAYLGLNMSETRLNLLFLVVLLSRLETDWRSIDTAFYLVCKFFLFFKKTYVFSFFSSCPFFFPFPFLFLMMFLFCALSELLGDLLNGAFSTPVSTTTVVLRDLFFGEWMDEMDEGGGGVGFQSVMMTAPCR